MSTLDLIFHRGRPGSASSHAVAHSVSRLVPGLALVVALAAGAYAIAPHLGLSPLVVGIASGAIVANIAPVPAATVPGTTFAARSLLRAGIVVLGLRLSLGDLATLGADGLVVVALTVTATFFGTRWLARRLGLDPELGLLVATGYSICGASAIAAVDGVVRADEDKTAYAITLVTVCGTLSIFALPAVAGLFGLSGGEFGVWVGGAVHDVGQVVATASHDGSAALESATVVKLTRVVLLAPLVALVAVAERRRQAHAGEPAVDTRRPPLVPLFVVGFLAAIVVRTSGVLSGGVVAVAADVEKIVLTIALVAMGLGVRLAKIRRLGARPLALGAAAWVLVAGVALVGTLLVGA